MVFGKSERPVATTFAPAARAAVGEISGSGTARGEDDRVRRHGADHLLADDATRGETDEDVRALQHLGQAAAAARGSSPWRDRPSPSSCARAVLVKRAGAVADDEIAHPGSVSRRATPIPATPAPEMTTLMSASSLPITFSALMRPPRTRIAVP